MKIRVTSFLALIAIIVFSFCAGALALRAKSQNSQNSQAQPHTTVYLHGRIYTNDPASPWAEAMATRDGKIRCVGKIDYVLLECGGTDPNSETI